MLSEGFSVSRPVQRHNVAPGGSQAVLGGWRSRPIPITRFRGATGAGRERLPCRRLFLAVGRTQFGELCSEYTSLLCT
jgi:hypothetical protein